MSLWLNMFGLLGFGKLKIVEMGEKSSMFRLDSSVIAKIYTSKYSSLKSPVCFIISGMLEKYLAELFGKNYVCEETSCIANGKTYCIFQIATQS